MRLWGALLATMLAGCIDHPDPPAIPDGSERIPPMSGTNQPSNPTQPTGPTADPKDAKSLLKEVVYVLMDAYDGGKWMCTGTLISKDIVVTAAHCLDDEMFESWQIVAPLASSKPRVSASRPARYSDRVQDIANPDIGLLRLDDPIDLPSYAVLTNVSDRVEKGEKISGLAIVREEEDFEAPFKIVSDLAVSSTKKLGYEHGFSTPYFSHGGDSGAGLFLIENGKVTHKLIAVARQPEPDRELDHFTRIDAEILSWFEKNRRD